jgi:hypothetical protein
LSDIDVAAFGVVPGLSQQDLHVGSLQQALSPFFAHMTVSLPLQQPLASFCFASFLQQAILPFFPSQQE